MPNRTHDPGCESGYMTLGEANPRSNRRQIEQDARVVNCWSRPIGPMVRDERPNDGIHRHPSLTPDESRRPEGGRRAAVPHLRICSDRGRDRPETPRMVQSLWSAVDPGGQRTARGPPTGRVVAEHLVGVRPSFSRARNPRRPSLAMTNGRAGRTSDRPMMPLSGHALQRFPANRVCIDCATVLSIYNDSDFCSVHARPRKLSVNRIL